MSSLLILLVVSISMIVVWIIYETSHYSRMNSNHAADELNYASPEAVAKAAGRLTSRVESIMRRHLHDGCVAIPLSEGANHGPACNELHHLLPGDPVWIREDENRPGILGVYSAGYRVGSLSGESAKTVLPILEKREMTASYVCQQNCYEQYGRVDIRLIVFYKTAEVTERENVCRTSLRYGTSLFVEETGGDSRLLASEQFRLSPDRIMPESQN